MNGDFRDDSQPPVRPHDAPHDDERVPAPVMSGPVMIRSSELTALAVRIATMEADVRRSSDTIADLRSARLPEATEAMRAELADLRASLDGVTGPALNAAVEKATADLTERIEAERRVLAEQIAATVGAANEWFVRTRDQLFERIKRLTELATPPPAGGGSAGGGSADRGSDGGGSDGGGSAQVLSGPRPMITGARQPGALGPGGATAWPGVAEGTDPDRRVPVQARNEAEAAAATALAEQVSALRAEMAGVRSELIEVSGGVATLGEALIAMQDDIDRLTGRATTLDEDQVLELIDGVVAAVRSSSTPDARRRPGRA